MPDARDVGHQLRLRGVIEIDELDEVRPTRDQDQSRIVGIVVHQRARERQVSQAHHVAVELREHGPAGIHENSRGTSLSGKASTSRPGGACFLAWLAWYRT